MRLLALTLFLIPLASQAQEHRLLPVDDPSYRWIERLVLRGHLLALHPTAAPYSEGEVRAALAAVDSAALSATETRWIRLLRRRLGPTTSRPTFSVEAGLDVVATNNDRLDVLRWTTGDEPVVGIAGTNLYPAATLGAALEAGPLIAQVGTRFDAYFEDDPDGLDVSNKRVFLRTEGGYIGAVSRYGEVWLGRIARRWSGAAEDGLFVSDNPWPYDGIEVRIGGGQASIRALLAELDAADAQGRFTGRTGDFSREPSLRRYLAAHRMDWRPSRRVAVSAIESMLISGNGTSVPLDALLPTAVYSFLNDEPPKNNEHNGLIGGHLWFQAGRVTVSGQLLMDDIDLFNASEPASVAVSGSVVAAGITDRMDAGLALTAITARVYNTGLPEQMYAYALRGIGLPFSDFVHARTFADLYLDDLVPGLTVRPELHLLVQGEGDFREPYLSNDLPLVFIGDEERTVRAGIQVHLQPSPWWWARADLGVNRTQNDAFVRRSDAVRFVGVVEAGARVRFVAFPTLDW